MATTQYDVIIIGTGAGGSTLAYHLSSSGKRILVLERGDFLPRERENWDSKAVFGEERYKTTENWYDKDKQPFRPLMHYYVGGNTKMYGAALLRMRETDSAKSVITAAYRRHGRFRTVTSNPTTPRPNNSITCMACGVAIPPSRPPLHRFCMNRYPTSRASSSLPMT